MPALGVQDNLRAWSDLRRYGVGGGISAMPSMHMSIVTLFVLAGWSVSRRWGLLATAFFVVIFLGSIHLGYHYAVDGYVSMALTTVIWVVSGWFAQAWLARDPAAAWTYRPQPATQA